MPRRYVVSIFVWVTCGTLLWMAIVCVEKMIDDALNQSDGYSERFRSVGESLDEKLEEM